MENTSIKNATWMIQRCNMLHDAARNLNSRNFIALNTKRIFSEKTLNKIYYRIFQSVKSFLRIEIH